MKWENLANNRCPECNSQLEMPRPGTSILTCRACPFRIGELKMQDIVDRINARRNADGPVRARGEGWGRFPDDSPAVVD